MLNFKGQFDLITGSSEFILWAKDQFFAQVSFNILLNGKHCQDSLDNHLKELKDKCSIESKGYL